MHSISASATVDIIAGTIIKLINAIKESSIAGNATSFSVDALHISTANAAKGYSWHYDVNDDKDEDDNFIVSDDYFFKNIITLVGPTTLFYPADTEFRQAFLASLLDRDVYNKHEEIIDYSKVSRANFGQGTVFEPTLTLHSFPIEQAEYRLRIMISKDDVGAGGIDPEIHTEA